MSSEALRSEIRAMVRSLLSDLAPQLAVAVGTSASDPAAKDMGDRISAAARRDGGAEIKVRIASDADLRAFAALFITCPDPVAQAAVLEGKVRLVLDNGPAAAPRHIPSPGAPAAGPGTPMIESGVLNERKVTEIAKAHKKVLLAPGVVVTPLGHDRARALGLEIVRKTP